MKNQNDHVKMNLAGICHHQSLAHYHHTSLEDVHHLELVIEVEQGVGQDRGGQGVGQEDEGGVDPEDDLDQEIDQENQNQETG